MFYGWWIVGCAFFAQMAIVGFYTYSFPILVVPLETEFAATRTQVMAGMTGASIMGMFLPPLLGPLVDKWSVRGLLTMGAAIFGISLLIMSSSQSILTITLVFTFGLASASAMLGPQASSPLVSRWFSRQRGLALGIASIGTSVGGLLMPLFINEAIEQLGWRQALNILAAIVLLGLLPLLFLLVRNFPEEKGLFADGAAEAPSQQGEVSGFASWQEIVKQRAFWVLSICLGLMFCSYSAVFANISAYAVGHGVSSGHAAALISVSAVLAMLAKFVFGALADRMNLKLLLSIAMVFLVFGISLLALQNNYAWMLASAALLGLAAGGMLPVWGALMPTLFGLTNFGRAMGFMLPIISGLVMPGFIVLGKIYDNTGSYESGLYLFAGVAFTALLLLQFLRLPARQNAAA